MSLFGKELGRVLRSVVYLAMVAGIVLFAYSQGVFPDMQAIQPPQLGQESYGTMPSDDPARIMPEAVRALYGEYLANEYTAYPNGLFKRVRLKEADREQMAGILSELTSRPIATTGITPAPDLTWDAFLVLMARADDLLGGGSDYAQTYMRHRFGQIPRTYDDAQAEYELIAERDRFTGAHARLYSDYLGIVLALLPVFPAVALTLRDRSGVAPVIHSRRVASSRLALTRFAALATAVLLPLLLMGAIQTALYARAYGLSSIDPFAYLKYTLFWQMPTAMVSLAAGMFLTTLTGTPIAIATQMLWWFLDIRGGSGAYVYVGRYTALVPRHNALGQTQMFLDSLPALAANRLLMAVLTAALLALTILACEMKRRGRLHVPVLGRRPVQPAA